MNIDFGVQMARPFEPEGNVQCIETLAGEGRKNSSYRPL